VPVSFGYHPYLRIPATSRDSWTVRLDAFSRLVLDERLLPTGERVPVERRSFRLAEMSCDDRFDALPVRAQFEVSVPDFALSVTFICGYPFAQVYAPSGGNFI
jgi:hypothetical protein